MVGVINPTVHTLVTHLHFLSICGTLILAAEIEKKIVEIGPEAKIIDTFPPYMTQHQRGL